MIFMRQLLVLFLTLSLFSCDQNTDTYKFEGEAVGFADVLYQVEEVVTFSNGEKRVQEFEVMGKNN